MTGCAVVTIPTTDGKLTPELIKPRLHNFGVCHHSQPKAVYISQVSELGTVYTVEEVKAIADLLHAHKYVSAHGRCPSGKCLCISELFDETGNGRCRRGYPEFWRGQNGMMMGEAVVSFRPEITENLQYYRKQSAQLASKLRYLSAQFYSLS